MNSLGKYSLPDSDVLLIVPPFAHISWPSLGVHLLQALGMKKNVMIRVFYANMLFASIVGRETYSRILSASRRLRFGERMFANAAFDLPIFGRHGDSACRDAAFTAGADSGQVSRDFHRAVSEVQAFCEALGRAVAAKGYMVVGCTSMFEQTLASLALLKAVKKYSPRTTTILGGANCEGPMADGLATTTPMVDFIFSGESEQTFCEFLRYVRSGRLPKYRVLRGEPCRELDLLPTPDYDDYYAQLRTFLPSISPSETWLVYESSRGCWWGEKSHCTFCGLNGQHMTFREKSPENVVADVSAMLAKYPTNQICMTDNIMPFSYHRTLVPRLTALPRKPIVFYEQKANLSLRQVVGLRDAGIRVIQPGIESLSTDLLRLVRKGVTARQNLGLLRYARICDLQVNWNLLYAIPGDRADEYARMLTIMPLLAHLSPPSAISSISIDRFSPYFQSPQQFGIRRLSAAPAYHDIFPDGANVGNIAYDFTASYISESANDRTLLDQFSAGVDRWQRRWKGNGPKPILGVTAIGNDIFLLIDTRFEEEGEQFRMLSRDQARAVIVGGRIGACALGAWALGTRYAVELDGWYVPLATADLFTMQELAPELLHSSDHARDFESCRTNSVRSNELHDAA